MHIYKVFILSPPGVRLSSFIKIKLFFQWAPYFVYYNQYVCQWQLLTNLQIISSFFSFLARLFLMFWVWLFHQTNILVHRRKCLLIDQLVLPIVGGFFFSWESAGSTRLKPLSILSCWELAGSLLLVTYAGILPCIVTDIFSVFDIYWFQMEKIIWRKKNSHELKIDCKLPITQQN